MQNQKDHHPLFHYAEVEQAFEDADECLSEDLSAVRCTLIRDVHYDDYDLEIYIHGQKAAVEDPPIVHLFQAIPEDFLVDGTPEIRPEMVIAIFDEKIQRVMIERGIPIEWNAGESSAQVIDLAGFDPDMRLEAEDC